MKRLTFLLVLLMSCGMIWAASDEPKGLEIGEKAPDFSLPGVDGKTYTLDDFSEAKILVMIFTCNHCPTAQAYEERIKKLVTDYGDKGVAVVAISPNDEKSVRLDEMGYTDLNDGLEDMSCGRRHISSISLPVRETNPSGACPMVPRQLRTCLFLMKTGNSVIRGVLTMRMTRKR